VLIVFSFVSVGCPLRVTSIAAIGRQDLVQALVPLRLMNRQQTPTAVIANSTSTTIVEH
jgi:hypothetical protein